jgi:aspartate aminotransferase-like enzyme
VLEAMARPMIHHRTPEFEAITRCMSAKLQQVFCTANPVVTIPGTGTTACEAALLSVCRPRDIVATFTNGKFGSRWASVYRRAGLNVVINDVEVSAPWGEAMTPERVEHFLNSAVGKRAAVFALVHCETSAGTTSDLQLLASMIRSARPDAIIIADCITSIGAIPVEPDEWGIDLAVCASQKALRNAPGLGFVSVSEHARQRLQSAGTMAPLSLSLDACLKGHAAGKLPYTAPVSNIVAQDVALDLILAEGLDKIQQRTADLAKATRTALTAMGFTLASQAPADPVTAVRMPEGSRDGLADEIRSVCKETAGIHLAGGQGDWAGQVIRISHMGAVTASDTIAGVEAIAGALKALGPIDGAKPEAGLESIHSSLDLASASEIMASASA